MLVSASSSASVDARLGAVGSRIDLDDVHRAYQVGESQVVALDDINLHVDEAAFVVVLGASGSGKTTLLNMIGALDTPTSGTVGINGEDITHASREQRRKLRRGTVSFIFQSFNLFPALTAVENVQFGADAAGRRDSSAVAEQTLADVGLTKRSRHFPHQLSGGEQ
jgi:putative ABC transport system ATP-binding protein